MASSTLFPSVGQDYTGTNVGSTNWTNPGNVTANDGSNANVVLGPSVDTKWLDSHSYGFAIPSDATVLGIVGTAEITGSTTGKLKGFQLLKAGVLAGTDKAPNLSFTGSLTVHNYGSSTDLWGTTWTPAEINSTGFGLALYVGGTFAGGAVIDVDYMQVTVYYSQVISGTAVLSRAVALSMHGSAPFVGRSNLSKPIIFSANASVPVRGTFAGSKPTILSAVGSPNLFVGHANLNKVVDLDSEGVNGLPGFSGYAGLSVPVELDALGHRDFYGGDFTVPTALIAAGTVSAPVFSGYAQLSRQALLANVGTSTPPIFSGTARLSKAVELVVPQGASTRFQSANLNMVVFGAVPSAAEGSLDIYVRGSETAELNPIAIGALPLFINSAYLADASLDMFVEGYSILRTSESSLDLFLAGDPTPINGVLPMFLMADALAASGVLKLYIKGDGVNFGYYYSTGTLDLFVEGTGSGSLSSPIYNEAYLDMFIKGANFSSTSYSNTIPMVLKVDGSATNGTLDLIVEGANPNLVSGTLDLVIPNTSMNKVLPLFVRGI